LQSAREKLKRGRRHSSNNWHKRRQRGRREQKRVDGKESSRGNRKRPKRPLVRLDWKNADSRVKHNALPRRKSTRRSKHNEEEHAKIEIALLVKESRLQRHFHLLQEAQALRKTRRTRRTRTKTRTRRKIREVLPAPLIIPRPLWPHPALMRRRLWKIRS
jgi:hypothetical protein